MPPGGGGGGLRPKPYLHDIPGMPRPRRAGLLNILELCVYSTHMILYYVSRYIHVDNLHDVCVLF